MADTEQEMPMTKYRKVTVAAERSVYRARVEPARRLWRVGYRCVVERAWSLLDGLWGPRAEDWRVIRRGRIRRTFAEAHADAQAWLDRAEARNPSDSDYVEAPDGE